MATLGLSPELVAERVSLLLSAEDMDAPGAKQAAAELLAMVISAQVEQARALGRIAAALENLVAQHGAH